MCVTDLNIGTPAFADDVALIALYKQCMNYLLGKAKEHSIKWRYNYNGDKFQALCFGKDRAPAQTSVW